MAYLVRHSNFRVLPLNRQVFRQLSVQRASLRPLGAAASRAQMVGTEGRARSATRLAAVAFFLMASAAQAEQVNRWPKGASTEAKNVLGGQLQSCCTSPMTGFYRDGFCRVGPGDHGVHAVCAQVTQEFLEFSASRGNDLRSVVQPGERWCLCVARWKEAKDAGHAPPVILESTSEDALSLVTLEELQEYAYKSDSQEL